MEAMPYLESGDPDSPRTRPQTGAGDNPSTWAGVIVLGAVLGLVIMRRGFRNFM